MKFRNFPMVPRIVYGRGSFDQTSEIIEEKRNKDYPFIFLVDKIFEEKEVSKKIPLNGKDKIIYIDTIDEPKTKGIDAIRDSLKEEFVTVSGIIGIGGGSVMDSAKAVAIMMNSEGSSSQYQGWDLVRNPAVYHVGIPTISGTGAEVSRTCILTGPERKLGINSDFTPFDQVILDPALVKGVEKNQAFFTGMDCYIHCIESLTGTYLNAFSKSYGEKALELCQKVYVHKPEWNE
jgi:3-deoxy-alpha-D-manno-octulosonate 8-oxidase